MTVETATWWSKRRFACISLAVSLRNEVKPKA